jgi:diguanylate cyclase (GGDEF)-like protein
MIRNQRVGLAVLLFFAALPARSGQTVYQQLEAAYERDSNETIALAQKFLQHPEKLSATDVLVVSSYLCETLQDQEQYDQALAQARPVIANLPISPAANQIEFSARLLTCAGFGAKQKKQFPEAMADFDRAIAIVEAKGPVGPKSPTDLVVPLSYALYRRAGLYDTLGDHAAALGDLTRAMRILPDRPDTDDRQGAQNLVAQRMNLASAIGKIHLHRKEYLQAAQSYEVVLRYTQQMKDEHAEAVIQLNLGECYRGLQRWQDSQSAYARALAVGTKLKDQVLLGRAHAGLGALARARKDDAGALANLSLAHSELSAAGMPLELGNADLERAEVLADTRDWQELSTLADQLVAALASAGDKHLLGRALDLRARAAEGKGDLAAALVDTRREVALQEEIQRAELENELAKRNVEFQVAQIEDRARLNAREFEDKSRLLARENELANLQIRHDRDISLAQRAAIAIAVAIVLALVFAIRRRIQTQRLLTRLAQEDGLTGLRNRRAALAAANGFFEASRRSGTPFSLALLDIDHFKRINDTHGHAAGDAVLVAVAACMREALRTDDICGRVGGEEFLFVFPRCDLDHASKLLEDIRSAIGALRIDGLPEDFRVALSAGLTERRADDTQLDVLVRRADVALYKAKHAGRDRVVVDAALAA